MSNLRKDTDGKVLSTYMNKLHMFAPWMCFCIHREVSVGAIMNGPENFDCLNCAKTIMAGR